MKRCDNCFESNSDGATNCVICGDPLDVPQFTSSHSVALSSTVEDFDDEEPVVDADEPEEVEVEVVDDEYADDETTRRDLQVTDEPLSIDRLPVDEIPLPRPTPADGSSPGPSPGRSAPPAGPTTGGRVALQVFHDTEPRVVHTHPIVNDITLVGREDPQRDVFPDLDLGRLPRAEVSSDRASRQHLRLLREGDRYYLYVYKGSTGTQVCDRMVDPASYGKRFEIQVGDRIILGGKLRMKLARVE